MSCGAVGAIAPELGCDCFDCYDAGACDACRNSSCLRARCDQRAKKIELEATRGVHFPCAWPDCAVTAAKVVVAGFSDEPKLYDVCAGHAAKFAGAA